MQPRGDLVAPIAELAPGVQFGGGQLQRRYPVLRMDVHRNAAPVIADAHRAVFKNRNLNVAGVAGKGFVNRVIHDLFDHMVQAVDVGRANVHAWPLSHGIKALKDRNLARVVALGLGSVGLLVVHRWRFLPRGRRACRIDRRSVALECSSWPPHNLIIIPHAGGLRCVSQNT